MKAAVKKEKDQLVQTEVLGPEAQDEQAAVLLELESKLKGMSFEFRAYDSRVMGFYAANPLTAFIPFRMYPYQLYKKTALPMSAVHTMTANGASASAALELSKQWKEQESWESDCHAIGFYSIQRLRASRLGQTLPALGKYTPADFKYVVLDESSIVQPVSDQFIRDVQVEFAEDRQQYFRSFVEQHLNAIEAPIYALSADTSCKVLSRTQENSERTEITSKLTIQHNATGCILGSAATASAGPYDQSAEDMIRGVANLLGDKSEKVVLWLDKPKQEGPLYAALLKLHGKRTVCTVDESRIKLVISEADCDAAVADLRSKPFFAGAIPTSLMPLCWHSHCMTMLVAAAI